MKVININNFLMKYFVQLRITFLREIPFILESTLFLPPKVQYNANKTCTVKSN